MMSNQTAPRWSGMAAIGAGLLVATLPLGDLVEWPEDFFFVVGVPVFFFLLLGLLGLRAAQGGRDGIVGGAGYVLASLASAALTILFLIALYVNLALGEDVETFLPEWVGTVVPVSFLVLALGVLLFGIGMLIARALPFLPSLLFLVAIPMAIAIDMASGAFFEENGATTPIGFYVGIPLFAISLVWLGAVVWSRSKAEPADTESSTSG